VLAILQPLWVRSLFFPKNSHACSKTTLPRTHTHTGEAVLNSKLHKALAGGVNGSDTVAAASGRRRAVAGRGKGLGDNVLQVTTELGVGGVSEEGFFQSGGLAGESAACDFLFFMSHPPAHTPTFILTSNDTTTTTTTAATPNARLTHAAANSHAITLSTESMKNRWSSGRRG